MNTMTDDTMALTVAEATMHDWLAALEFIRTCPPPAWTPSPRSPVTLSHPVQFAAAPVRRAVRRPATIVARQAVQDQPAVGGARTLYWLALAAALAAIWIF